MPKTQLFTAQQALHYSPYQENPEKFDYAQGNASPEQIYSIISADQMLGTSRSGSLIEISLASIHSVAAHRGLTERQKLNYAYQLVQDLIELPAEVVEILAAEKFEISRIHGYVSPPGKANSQTADIATLLINITNTVSQDLGLSVDNFLFSAGVLEVLKPICQIIIAKRGEVNLANREKHRDWYTSSQLLHPNQDNTTGEILGLSMPKLPENIDTEIERLLTDEVIVQFAFQETVSKYDPETKQVTTVVAEGIEKITLPAQQNYLGSVLGKLSNQELDQVLAYIRARRYYLINNVPHHLLEELVDYAKTEINFEGTLAVLDGILKEVIAEWPTDFVFKQDDTESEKKLVELLARLDNIIKPSLARIGSLFGDWTSNGQVINGKQTKKLSELIAAGQSNGAFSAEGFASLKDLPILQGRLFNDYVIGQITTLYMDKMTELIVDAAGERDFDEILTIVRLLVQGGGKNTITKSMTKATKSLDQVDQTNFAEPIKKIIAIFKNPRVLQLLTGTRGIFNPQDSIMYQIFKTLGSSVSAIVNFGGMVDDNTTGFMTRYAILRGIVAGFNSFDIDTWPRTAGQRKDVDNFINDLREAGLSAEVSKMYLEVVNNDEMAVLAADRERTGKVASQIAKMYQLIAAGNGAPEHIVINDDIMSVRGNGTETNLYKVIYGQTETEVLTDNGKLFQSIDEATRLEHAKRIYTNYANGIEKVANSYFSNLVGTGGFDQADKEIFDILTGRTVAMMKDPARFAARFARQGRANDADPKTLIGKMRSNDGTIADIIADPTVPMVAVGGSPRESITGFINGLLSEILGAEYNQANLVELAGYNELLAAAVEAYEGMVNPKPANEG